MDDSILTLLAVPPACPATATTAVQSAASSIVLPIIEGSSLLNSVGDGFEAGDDRMNGSCSAVSYDAPDEAAHRHRRAAAAAAAAAATAAAVRAR